MNDALHEVNGRAGMPDLTDAACYPHPVEAVKVMETHISRVFLTGEYAYKLKKRVALGFLDFTALRDRRRYCEDEVRLNRRLAPALYLDVVSVHETPDGPRIDGAGPIVDYAVKMRQFPQGDLASAMLARGALSADDVAALARRIAAFHAGASCDAQSYGTPAAVQASAAQNFEQIAPHVTTAEDRARLARVRQWTADELPRLAGVLQARHDAGRVREVHGDLHLGNIVRLGDELVPFDCIEFSAALRWNDVMSEVAFLVMDLDDRGAPRLGHVFLDTYLEDSGDYEGLDVLRFFMVYRAVVRAKIHLMRAAQMTADRGEQRRLTLEYRRYMSIAASYMRRRKPFLILMHGLAASGKSTMARQIAPAFHAIRIRSDLERKRLAGLAAQAATHSPVGGGLYTPARGKATYARLAELAGIILDCAYPALVDATFLRASDRRLLTAVAQSRLVPWSIVTVDAPLDVLAERIVSRAAAGGDPSEANLAVLEHQMNSREPLAESEQRRTVVHDGREPVTGATYAAIAGKLRMRVRPPR